MVDLATIPRPAVTVDIVVLTIRDGRLQVLLIERGRPPFQGRRALPGGFLHVGDNDAQQGGESLDEAAARELVEETGLSRDQVLLEQFGVYGDPGRDPRGRTVSVAFFALVSPDVAGFVKGGSDAAHAEFVDVADARGLAFDHDAIVDGALARVRAGVARAEDVAFALAPRPFTIRELQEVHEILLQKKIGAGPFRKRFAALLDEKRVEKAAGRRVTAKRPAAVYVARR